MLCMAPIVFANNRGSQLSKFEKLKIWRLMKFLTNKTGTKTWDPPSVANGATTATTAVTVTGAKAGDKAYAKFSNALPKGAFLTAVSSTDTVTVALVNNSGATLDLASGTLTARSEDRTKNNH